MAKIMNNIDISNFGTAFLVRFYAKSLVSGKNPDGFIKV